MSSDMSGTMTQTKLGRRIPMSLTLSQTTSYFCPTSFRDMSQTYDWCTKKQAAKLLNRTDRTISRIVRDAVENRTTDILSNLKLVYADGREVHGKDVTIDLLTKNEKEGTRTRWFFRKDWWRDVFVVRLNAVEDREEVAGDTIADEPEPDPDRGVTGAEPPALPADPTVRSIVLEHLHFNDQKHATEIKQLMDRVLQVVETNQQLQGQTNTLYNQFQDALKQSGGLKALVEGASNSKASTTPVNEKANARVLDTSENAQRTTAPAKRTQKKGKPSRKPAAVKSGKETTLFPTFVRIARFLSRNNEGRQ
jgi:hypothetical protein